MNPKHPLHIIYIILYIYNFIQIQLRDLKRHRWGLGQGLHALQSVGSTLESRLAFRQGYALIGVKDGEAMAERKGPMVMAEAQLMVAIRAPVRA